MKTKLAIIILCITLLLVGCQNQTPNGKPADATPQPGDTPNGVPGGRPEDAETVVEGATSDLGGDGKSFGEDIESSGAYDGLFEGESQDFTIECLSGTEGAYKIEGTTLTFTEITEKTVYSISGSFGGNIIIDVGDSFKFDLELHGFSLVSNSTNPITILSGDEVTIKAKKETKNYIYDTRSAIDSADETLFSGAIHSAVDLEMSGKGELIVISENNNGIHSKDDLQIKNLTLYVACLDNALKGNDSVEIIGGSTTLIAAMGDGVKTSNSGISEKGNQRGTVSITGGIHSIYAACDGIDSAYNVIIDDSATVLNIYTDKYSNYSKEVTSNSSDTNYIRFTSNAYYYSVKYYNSDTDYIWVDAEYHSKISGGRTNYYYYSYPKMPEYQKQQFFIYETEDQRGQDEEYLVASDYLTPNTGCDTLALTNSYNGLYYEWTNYTTQIQEGGFGGPGGRPGGAGGPGGMNDGNTDKGDHSTKGIKAANEIVINEGTINIKSYDDAIHANSDTALETGVAPLGNVTVNGGNLTLYTNDDGIHADGTLSIVSGSVSIANAYEGLEGRTVSISGGCVSVYSKDDGINATTTSGTAITISGGEIYIYCSGDGIDSNSRTANTGIVFSGGKTVVISTSSMNSSIDTENGYTYSGGAVVAIMPRGGMSNEATHCTNFQSIGAYTQLTLTNGEYLAVGIGDLTATIKSPISLNSLIVVLGDNSPSIKTESASDLTFNDNGVNWH